MSGMRVRGWGAATALAMVSAFVVVGAGQAAAAPAPTTVAGAVRPSLAPLTAGQVAARSKGKRERVVILLNDQLPKLPANRAHRHARAHAAKSMQAPVVAQLKKVGATHIQQLWLVNAVAASVPAAEAQALRHTAGVKQVVQDATVVVGNVPPSPTSVSASQVQRPSSRKQAAEWQRQCTAARGRPLIEPEALTVIHDASDNPRDTTVASRIATGKGVIVGNVDANSLAGNPNMIRPDGDHVVIDAPDPTENRFSDEFNGDVTTIGAQGTVTYSFAKQLPYSNIPADCTFRLLGDATGASILSTGYFSNTNALGQIVAPVSQVVAGLQQAVSEGANVVSESYGYGALPGANTALLVPANDAMVKAGVVVVESAGDSGSSGTVEAPADDPNVIDVGGTNDLRLLAQAYGYPGWEDNNMTTLSSGGTAPNGRVVDLVAPGFASLAAAGNGNPTNLPTETFGGTSEAAPFVAGAAADVIQAYRDTHAGATPSPAQVKQILTSTATDIGAEADQQGAGLLNVYAAVKAAQQMPGTAQQSSRRRGSGSGALVTTPTQIDVQARGNSTVRTSVSLYNASSSTERVSGTYRALGAERKLGRAVTETVSAPPPSATIPEQGATAARPIYFTVPRGVSVLDADMRWPDPANNAILTFLLTDPAGRVAQQSYDYGGTHAPGGSPDIQHSTVEHPMPGRWKVQILWNNGRGQFQVPPAVPGSYSGTVTFQASAQTFTTRRATRVVTIPAHSSVTVPLRVRMPREAGDHAESVQFSTIGRHGGRLLTSLPVARRTLIPSRGGFFAARLTSSVSRGPGQIKTFYVRVPQGRTSLDVSFFAPDHAANDPVHYYLLSPADLQPSVTESGQIFATAIDTTPTAGNPTGRASLIAPHPEPGMWEIDVMQGDTTDGTVFSQTVLGRVSYNSIRPATETGLPTSTSTILAPGSGHAVTVTVTNSTNHLGFFELQSSTGDITGGNASTPKRLSAGATGTLTATLTPTAAAGTAVQGTLSVVDSTDWGARDPIGFPASSSDFYDFAYAYTVGAGPDGQASPARDAAEH